MDIFQNNILSGNKNFGLQSNFMNNKTVGFNNSAKVNNNKSAYYAKKGEPMYMKDMDSDEDGIVSFEEFKDYCAENGISTKEMMKMVETANAYRTMQAQKKVSKGILNNAENFENTDKDIVYAKRGDGKYDEVMDINSDDKVTYKEYMEYCREHSTSKENKSSAKIEENENNEFIIKNAGKALNTYSKDNFENQNGMIEGIC